MPAPRRTEEPADEIVHAWPEYLRRMGPDFGPVRRFLLTARPRAEGGTLVLEVSGEWGVDYLRRKKTDDRLVQLFGREIPIRFEVVRLPPGGRSLRHGGRSLRHGGRSLRPEAQEVETAPPAASPPNAQAPPTPRSPRLAAHRTEGFVRRPSRRLCRPSRRLCREDVLLGRGRFQTPVPIASLKAATGRATIEGEVVEVRRWNLPRGDRSRKQGGRDLRHGKARVVLLVWDGTGSIFAEAERKEDRLPPLFDLDPPARVRLAGRVVPPSGFRPPGEGGSDLRFRIEEAARIPACARTDDAETKRVELHLHTRMSRMDGLIEPALLVERAKAWGWDAVAVTDRDSTQALVRSHAAAKKAGVKLILGVELAVVDDDAPPVRIAKTVSPGEAERLLTHGPWFVFDIETTGLSPRHHEIIEVAAERLEGDRVSGEFDALVRPRTNVSEEILELTRIRADDLAAALPWEDVAPRLAPLADGAVWVAHNASFDATFLERAFRDVGCEVKPAAVVDTLALSRLLDPDARLHGLDKVAKRHGLPFSGHHRAANDARITTRIFRLLRHRAEAEGLWPPVGEAARRMSQRVVPAALFPFRAVALAAKPEGLVRINEWLTDGYLNHFRVTPKIPRTRLDRDRARDRENPTPSVLLGASAVEGEIVEKILDGVSDDEILAAVQRYDYVEVAPPASYAPLVAAGRLPEGGEAELVREVIAYADRAGVPVVATSQPRALDPEAASVRALLAFADSDGRRRPPPNEYLMTTNELLDAMRAAGLSEADARRVVVEAPRALAEKIGDVPPLPEGFHPPRIPGAEETLERDARARAEEVYGAPLPEPIAARLAAELGAIVENGYASLYLIARDLVADSRKAGYAVGSRGSVGSSFVAFLLGITEVNPLAPHHRCPTCKTVTWHDGAACGADLPEADCSCGTKLVRDGWRIPFEAFLGIGGNKVPDIDLNFSGLWQGEAMRRLEERFGPDRVFRAGTVLTVKEKTGIGFALKYRDALAPGLSDAEVRRLALGVAGTARSTGQHPGGVVILPESTPITRFMPAQRPPNGEGVTTHFDFHAYEGTLLKLDCLGHDGPTALRLLGDMTGVDPEEVPVNDPEVLELFSSTEPLGVDPKRLGVSVGTLGIPEFGTPLVRQILERTAPRTVEEIVRIAGLSHGTGVWQGNAEDLIASGRATLSQVIATREDIWNELVGRGIGAEEAFRIMEKVRKGKGVTDEEVRLLRGAKCPGWLVESLRKIEYLFPKAHAVAYCLTSLRIAWFKVHRPAAFYAQHFSLQVKDFDLATALGGPRRIQEVRKEIAARIRAKQATPVDVARAEVLEVAWEAALRGIEVLPPRVSVSDAWRFIPEDGGLRAPFAAVAGLGAVLAERIVRARKRCPFRTIDDFAARTETPRPILAALREAGAFEGLDETDQLGLL